MSRSYQNRETSHILFKKIIVLIYAKAAVLFPFKDVTKHNHIHICILEVEGSKERCIMMRSVILLLPSCAMSDDLVTQVNMHRFKWYDQNSHSNYKRAKIKTKNNLRKEMLRQMQGKIMKWEKKNIFMFCILITVIKRSMIRTWKKDIIDNQSNVLENMMRSQTNQR